MCRRGRGCGPSPAAYTRPRFPSLGVPGEEAAASASTPAPSPGSTKNQYEAFCALCGLGLMYRVRCTNAQMLGMAELVREPLSSDRYYIYNSYLGEERRAVEGPRTLSCWSRYATGIELDLTTFSIGQAPRVLKPYVPQSSQPSQTVHGDLIESVIGDIILTSKPTRTIPAPPKFAPNFNRNMGTGTASPVAGPSTPVTTGTADGPTQSPEKATYIMHNQCYEILKLAWARENVPCSLPPQDSVTGAFVARRRVTGNEYVRVTPRPHESNPAGRAFASHWSAYVGVSEASIGTSTKNTDTGTTATTAGAQPYTTSNDNINSDHILPALFTALHNLGRMPGNNYWSENDCEISEADFPGPMNGRRGHVSDGGAAEAAVTDTMPHLGFVSSRAMWPHLNPHDERDEFCPGIDYTGTALVALADPKEIPCLQELMEFTSPASSLPPIGLIANGSTSTSSSPSHYYPRSPSSFIWSLPSPPSMPTTPPMPTPRICPTGRTTPTDPFTHLPPELLLHILGYLSLPHISSFRLASRYLAYFIHPPHELPVSYFKNAFCSGGQFEFLSGLPVLRLGGRRGLDLGATPERSMRAGEEVDWRGLYRRVQYFLEANPEAAAGSSMEKAGKKPVCAIVPRSPGLANRKRIWGVCGRVVREMSRVMREWGAAEVGV